MEHTMVNLLPAPPSSMLRRNSMAAARHPTLKRGDGGFDAAVLRAALEETIKNVSYTVAARPMTGALTLLC